MKPNVIVLGVGHSGTTILTRMLIALGWNGNDADEAYAESVSIREMNEHAWRYGLLPSRAAEQVERLRTPWVLKDPRFCETLHLWTPLLIEKKPALIWITRNPDATEASYRKRGEGAVIRGKTRQQNRRNAARQYADWPFAKLHISLEQITAAVELFDTQRVQQWQRLFSGDVRPGL